MALPLDILRTIKDLSRRVTSLETTPQPPNIKISSSASAVVDVASSGSAGDLVLVSITLSDENSSRLLATPHFSLYKNNSVSTANLYPFGSNWTGAEVAGLNVYSWNDWGTTDNNNVVFKIYLINNSASSFNDLLIRINFRFLTREVTTS